MYSDLLLRNLSNRYPNEGARAENARERLGKSFVYPSTKQRWTLASSTDGASQVSIDHTLGNWAYHARFWATHRSYYPGPYALFLVVLAGPSFGLAGRIFNN
jgi:hypothetical protein